LRIIVMEAAMSPYLAVKGILAFCSSISDD
jgi:hypothetical protein